ncbi:MAG: T9SS type A sorting domain-containing protein [Candidatus Kapabacteria bacterium]|nr:T9SS type A sorting domain-containing protein [Candidatus Kapabacteria bacterium]
MMSNLAYSAKPDIVWEKQYKFDSESVNPWIFMNYSDTGILIWAEGISSNSQNNTLSILHTDIYGNINVKKNYNKPENTDPIFINAKIFKKNNIYEIIGIYSSDYSVPIKKFQIDTECNVTGDLSDIENHEELFSIATPNYMYDSIYVGFRDMKYLDDSITIVYNQSHLVYDTDINFTRKLTFDTTGINEPLAMTHPQGNIFPNNDKSIIAMLSGPIDTKAGFFGKTDYIFLCNFNLSGNLNWKCKLDITETGFNRVQIVKVHHLSDGSYNFIGRLTRGNQFNTESAAIIGNITDSGQLNWSKVINYNSYKVIATKIPTVINVGNHFVLYGYIHISDLPKRAFWMMIVDKDGNKLDEYDWKTENDDNGIVDVQETESGNLIILGRDGWNSIYLAEIQPKLTSVKHNENLYLKQLDIYPNPSTDFIDIKLNNEASLIASREVQIFDMLGIKVMSESINLMNGSHRMNISGLPAGVYYIRIGDKVEKFLKM